MVYTKRLERWIKAIGDGEYTMRVENGEIASFGLPTIKGRENKMSDEIELPEVIKNCEHIWKKSKHTLLGIPVFICQKECGAIYFPIKEINDAMKGDKNGA